MSHNYFVYITTNPSKTILYVGMTNDLKTRIQQHFESRGDGKHFASKYYCYNLIYWERFQWVQHAIEREKEIKKWRREKKEALIEMENSNWGFLNYSDLS
ncbi:MAG: GIY-YIG nuclease family protein [Cyclobacteriaceae bacterium]